MGGFEVGILLGWCGIGGLIGYLCGQARGRASDGFFLGLLLGIIGWLLILIGPDERRKCPACKGAIPDGARKCLHCGESFNYSTPAPATTNPIQKLKADPITEIRLTGLEPIYCPGCNSLHSIDKEVLGKGVVCPTCNTGFITAAIK